MWLVSMAAGLCGHHSRSGVDSMIKESLTLVKWSDPCFQINELPIQCALDTHVQRMSYNVNLLHYKDNSEERG